MKQFFNRLLKFILFLPFAWACVFSLGYLSPSLSTLFIAKPTLEGAVYLKSREFTELPEQDLDILFLGSSTCYCGIDPHHFENAFSLCSSAQKIGNSREVFDIALIHGTPRTTVIDIYPTLWTGDLKSIESTRDWIINSPFYNSVEADDLYSYLLQFYFEISDVLQIQHSPYGAPASDNYRGLGFVARDKEPLSENPCEGSNSYSMPASMSNALLEIDQQTDLILLVPPTLCEVQWSLPESLSHIPVIDGASWPSATNPSMYYDDHHLVANGAESYSVWLAEQLTSIRR